MNPPQVLVSGQPLALGRMIGKGGEGEVYSVAGNAAQAVKLYTTCDVAGMEAKVAAMVKGQLATRWPLAAFPLAVVHQRDGAFAGFVMKLVAGHRALHDLYAPGSRKQHFPQADYRFLVRAATNIARAFASVHQAGCVVGDINHSGILVSAQATAALIDADSFQFTDGAQRYLCRVGVPEYTPPELQGNALDGVVRTPDHDAFGLAVVMFQVLLMGRHPFVGAVRKGDIPPLHENIENYRYVYAEDRDVGMVPPPGTPRLSGFSAELATVFARAFARAAQGRRPTAQEWVASLERLEASLVRCPANPLHYRPAGTADCAWCSMERQLGTILFLPYVAPGRDSATGGEVLPNDFNLEVIWARIERVAVPTVGQLRPQLPTLSLTASESALAAKNVKPTNLLGIGLTLLVIGGGLLFLGPKLLPLAVLTILAGIAALFWKRAKLVNIEPFKREAADAAKQWARELSLWQGRAGVQEAVALREALATAKQQYTASKTLSHQVEADYLKNRREIQLAHYLEGFDVIRAKITGIGPAKIAALASYGIDTAADVIDQRLYGVPGFGPALTSRMIAWRRLHEARFVYNSSITDADRREVSRIRAVGDAALTPLRKVLSAGVVDLERRVLRVQAFTQMPDPMLLKVHERLEQARVDLAFFGIARVPTMSPIGHAVPSSSQQGGFPSAGAVSAMTKSCPRCGSAMVRRSARQGHNAGRPFWGCSNFPRCKGVIQI